MKISLKMDEGTRAAKEPFKGSEHVVVEGACPNCDANPFKVAGFAGTRVETHDTIEAVAACLGCQTRVGKLVVKVDTIFGIEEDRRVLAGPWRVY
jgi:hypothetical protein